MHDYVQAFKPNGDDEWRYVCDDGTAIGQAYIDGVEPLGGQCRNCGTADRYRLGTSRGGRYFAACIACGEAYPIVLKPSREVVF